jgi:CopG family nickel-responsive transcriptional regulator
MSINEQVLQKFDTVFREKGYTTRSEAFRDALRDFVDKNEWAIDEGMNSAIIAIIYEEKNSQESQISTIQHKYQEVQATLHVHLDDLNCLEILVAKGSSKQITEMIRQIRKISGIKQLKFIATASNI